MAQLRNTVRAYGPVGEDPGRIVAATGQLLALTAPYLYATMVYLEVDPAAGVVRYANAGHPSPLVVGPAGTVAALNDDAGDSGPLLGLADMSGLGGAAYPTRTVPLAPGSTLVAYTDGLVEDPTSDIGAGIERLRAAAARLCSPGRADRLSQLLDDIIAATLAGRRQRDDLCLLVAVDLGRPSGKN
jgi:serine phosphatase RsbU (regulator of sigma subunit)